jgi:hypothetical protein
MELCIVRGCTVVVLVVDIVTTEEKSQKMSIDVKTEVEFKYTVKVTDYHDLI